ncbi:unnamed protein product [Acanthoscelides obtectus]|uniref:Uncharacterized protein n=1 Tax=Acanthoscelides obtectus TaxID=200917 RepID=A0A9P0LH32_ACAOB|nr:unnamed protein product [Acanthoscelides obtectus]CAK1640656.1 hypothetical protein AOBTE_LOCUS11847 [Acanthoscelides obtectus]
MPVKRYRYISPKLTREIERERLESPNSQKVVCRDLEGEHSALLKECAASRTQLVERDKTVYLKAHQRNSKPEECVIKISRK